MAGLNERELALATFAGVQQQAAAAAQRVAVAAGVQLRLLELHYATDDEAVIDEKGTAEVIATAAVRHADALFAALASAKASSRY